MSERFTFTVEVYTGSLVFSGSYDLPLYRRVSDALNSRLHRFVTLRDAAVTPLWRPQQSQRVPQLLVDWSSAMLVATIAEPEPPPGFQPPMQLRDTQPMMFFTSAFALRADFFKRTDLELLSMLSELTDDFLPLSNVTLYPLQGGAPVNHGFVCLNRLHIQALYAVGTKIDKAPLPAAQLDPPPGPAMPPPPLAVPPPVLPPDHPTEEAPASEPLANGPGTDIESR